MTIEKQIEFITEYIRKVEWTGKTAKTETKKLALRRLWHGMKYIQTTLESLLEKETYKEFYQWKSLAGEPIGPSKYAIQLLKENQKLREANLNLILIINTFPILKGMNDETNRQQADGSLDG